MKKMNEKMMEFVSATDEKRMPNRRMLWLNTLNVGEYDKEALKNYLKFNKNHFPYRTRDEWALESRAVKKGAKPKMVYSVWVCVNADTDEYVTEEREFFDENATKIVKVGVRKQKAKADKGTMAEAEQKAKKNARAKAGMTIDKKSVAESVERDHKTDLEMLKEEYANIGKMIAKLEKNNAEIERLEGVIARADAQQNKRRARLAMLKG